MNLIEKVFISVEAFQNKNHSYAIRERFCRDSDIWVFTKPGLWTGLWTYDCSSNSASVQCFLCDFHHAIMR